MIRMGMYATYGAYTHAENEMSVVSHTVNPMAPSPRGGRIIDVITLQMTGVLHADTPEALTTAIALFELAYSVDGYDFVLRHSDGTPTRHAVYSNGTLNGTRVSWSWVGSNNAEYTTYRTYQLTVTAERISPDGLFYYEEQVQVIGNGGPVRVWKTPTVGRPIRQTTTEASVCRASQSGVAIGWNSIAPRNRPIWPDLLVNQSEVWVGKSPRVHRLGRTEFMTQWSYQFESGEPFGTPSPTVR